MIEWITFSHVGEFQVRPPPHRQRRMAHREKLMLSDSCSSPLRIPYARVASTSIHLGGDSFAYVAFYQLSLSLFGANICMARGLAVTRMVGLRSYLPARDESKSNGVSRQLRLSGDAVGGVTDVCVLFAVCKAQRLLLPNLGWELFSSCICKFRRSKGGLFYH